MNYIRMGFFPGTYEVGRMKKKRMNFTGILKGGVH